MGNVLVKSNLANDMVALWDRDPSHPNGEIFVAGDAIVEAAETPRVLQALAEGKLVKVEWEHEPLPFDPKPKPGLKFKRGGR